MTRGLGATFVPNEYLCDGSYSCGSDDGDDLDCDDPICATAPACVSPDAEDCLNGVDDSDPDEDVDCADDECADDPVCAEICDDDDRDNDGDGDAGCDDADCDYDPACTENCEDGRDNDLDGKYDCDDESCADYPPCTDGEICDDGDDNDGDDDRDCDDADCADDPACAGTTTTGGCDPDVVISGVYTQGGVGYGDWANDFVELANRTSTDVDLSGLALHVAGSDHVWRVIDLAGHTIPADGYFQVELGGGFAFQNLPLPSPDLRQPVPRTDLSSTGSAVVLASTLVPAATGACLTTDVVDAVGLYSASFCAEGYPVLQGVVVGEEFRRTDVCVDTDVNAIDVAVRSMSAPSDSSDTHPPCTCP